VLAPLAFGDIALLLAAPAVGSFLGTLILRLPVERPVVAARSACPHCHRRLGAVDLVPLLSWLASGGRCRSCGTALGLFYPAVELAALAVAVWSVALFPGWLAWASAVLGWVLLTAAEIDRRHLLLPDVLVLPLVAAGPVVLYAAAPWQVTPAVLGAAGGFALLTAVARIYRRARGREGLGLGDAKLFAAAGAWTTIAGLPSVLLVAAAGGLAAAGVSAYRNGGLSGECEMPFGPFLAAGLWLVWSFGPIQSFG
jgi:leader peptidase (prepilin peptidase)/N-methyltransferase